MNYELVKQLKDAGFPQKGKGLFMSDDTFMNNQNINDHIYYFPTLSELIEACGDKFRNLDKGGWDENTDKFDENMWWASSRTHECECDNPEYKEKDFHVNWETGTGSTPEEAVARLWLELKSNNK